GGDLSLCRHPHTLLRPIARGAGAAHERHGVAFRHRALSKRCRAYAVAVRATSATRRARAWCADGAGAAGELRCIAEGGTSVMNRGFEQEPSSMSELAVGTIALTVVALITFFGVHASPPAASPPAASRSSETTASVVAAAPAAAPVPA